jgi:hypothetical protein
LKSNGLLTAEDVGGYQSPESFRALLLFGLISGDESDHEAQQDESDGEFHDVESQRTEEQENILFFYGRVKK